MTSSKTAPVEERLVAACGVSLVFAFISLMVCVTSGPKYHHSFFNASFGWKASFIAFLAPTLLLALVFALTWLWQLMYWVCTGRQYFI